MTDTASVIRHFEGYIDHAKWDKNAYRAGYGSDTTTLEDGSVVPITKDSVVTREDSERDLSRRSAEFANTARGQVGSDVWDNLPDNAKAVLTSVAYNYGSLPHNVASAAQSGDMQATADAIRSREGDNGGINKGRRNQEADILLNPDAKVNGGVAYDATTEVPVMPNAAVAGAPREDAPEDPSLWQSTKDSFWQNNTVGIILNSNPYAADPNWVKPNEQQITSDLEKADLDPERYAKFLGGSTSQKGYMKAIQDAQADRDRLERLSRVGFTGTALNFVSQTLDPIDLATSAAIGAVAPELTLAKYGARVSKVVNAAIAGGAAGLATTSLRYGFDRNATKADLLVGTVLGAGIGGIAGRLLSHPSTASEGRQLQTLAQNAVGEHVGVPMAGRGSAGAAAVHQPKGFLDPDSAMAMVEHSDTPRSAFAKERIDLSAMGDKSLNPATRMTMDGLVQDGTGKIGGAINGRAASEEKEMLKDEFMGAFYRTWAPQKKSFMAKGGTELEFNDKVFQYVEDRQLGRETRYPEEVRKAGDAWAHVRAEELKLQKNPLAREDGVGRPVQGAENTPIDKHYMVHEWQPEKVHLADDHFEEGTVLNVIKGGIRSANPKLIPDDLDRVSAAFLKSLKSRGAGIDQNDFIARLSGESMSDALDALVDTSSLTRAEADNFLKNWEADTSSYKSDVGNAKPFKRRTLIDTSYVLPYRPRVRATGLEHDAEFGVKDLMNRNVEYLNNKYTNRAAGNIALARMRLATADIVDKETGEVVSKGTQVVDGITSDAEWRKHLSDVRKRGEAAGQTAREIDKDIERLQYAYEMIKGTKYYEFNNGVIGKGLRMLRKFNFIRMMNQVGLASIPELGNVVGSVGMKAALQQMPDLRRVINQAGASELSNSLGADLEAVFGHGLDGWKRHPSERYDALMDTIKGTQGGSLYQRLNAVLDRGQEITSKISGMEAIDTMSRRWAYKGIVQRFANAAAKGNHAYSAKRLADLGLSKEMSERVMTAFKDPKAVQMNGKQVAGLKLDQWSDKEAAEAFRRAVYRKAGEIIQKNDLGNMNKMLSHPVGQTLMQFRTFMMASYVKQGLKALHMRDPESFINVAMGSLIGALIYEVQTREQAVGRSDADKFLKDRLHWDKIAAAGFAKTGASSILPMLADTALPVFGYKPEFSYTRTTGQTSDIWLGNPGSGSVDDLLNAASASRGIAHGDLSQEEARAMWKIMPFNNALGILQGFNAAISGLHQRTPSSRKNNVGLFGD